VFANVSYGVRNNDFNGSLRLNRLYNPFTRSSYAFSVSRNFHFIYSGDAWINMLKRSNYYLNNQLTGEHTTELVNGFFVRTGLNFALRRSVAHYKTNSKVDSVLGTVLLNNQPVFFEPYNALYGRIKLSYTPNQKYIREPREKIIIGSDWPTFSVSWRKGIPGILNSKVDFDYLEFAMDQEIRLGLMGTSRYKFATGKFINKTDLRLIDYKYQRRGDPLLFMNPDEAFQALDSTFPVFNQFYQVHYIHEFNGAFLNRIPLLKKLELREIGGGGVLLAPERNLKYLEAFAGVERIFRWPFNPLAKVKVGVYVVSSFANKFNNPLQFKVGLTTWDILENKWR
jgi:hypothetical protein